MGHFEGRDDIQIYVGDDGKVYDTPAEETVLADSVDAFFGDNGKAPKPSPTPPGTPEPPKENALSAFISKIKGKPKKETRPRRLRKNRFEMVDCTICGKAKKKGAGMTKHMSMMHPEEG